MAAWPARTWTPAERVTAGMMNGVRDQLNELHDRAVSPTWTQVNTSFGAGAGLYNWDPGIIGDTIIYMSSPGNLDLTGFVSRSPVFVGQRIHIVHLGSLGPVITFFHEHASSSPPNQLHIRQGTGVTIGGYWAVAEFQYSIFPVTGVGGWVLGHLANGAT